MVKKIFYICALIIVASCSSENEISEAELYEVRDIGELSTTEYTIGKIIKLDDSDIDFTDFDWTKLEWPDLNDLPKIGQRKLLMSCKAKVKAGVDLSKIKEGDIKVSGSTIEITLPEAEITSFSMDPNSVRTKMENVSGFRDEFTQKEKNEFLKQGEKSIKEDMNSTKILKDANDNAENFLKDFYSQKGFDKIIVKRKSNE